MVVQHNLTAMNSNRMLGITQSAQAKVSEKLSSGYKINRAADDAAGLSISEKMRKQIQGLDKAATNAQDGVSAVQTAEGALTEVHSMLQRMNELAVQASNGTNSESDRESIQAEIEQLTTEIDRVAETTKFNETYLLKGNASGATSDKLVAAHDAGIAGELQDNEDGTYTFTLHDKSLDANDKLTIAGREYIMGETKVSVEDGAENVNDMQLNSGETIIVKGENGGTSTSTKIVDTLNATIVEDFEWSAGDKVTVSGVTYEVLADGETWKNATVATDTTLYSTTQVETKISGAAASTVSVTNEIAKASNVVLTSTAVASTQVSIYDTDGIKDFRESLNGKQFMKGTSGDLVIGTDGTANEKLAFEMIKDALTEASSIGTDTAATVKNNGDGTFTITQGKVNVKDALNFNLHVGADADMTNKINVDIESMSAANLGIKGISVADDTGMKATYAIDAISDALAKVSEQRSALGAIQNRLEHTIANLDNVVENTTAAESRIRDTDMAEEMVEYSKNNILAQAGQSMLAQANQSTQGVLSLLG